MASRNRKKKIIQLEQEVKRAYAELRKLREYNNRIIKSKDRAFGLLENQYIQLKNSTRILRWSVPATLALMLNVYINPPEKIIIKKVHIPVPEINHRISLGKWEYEEYLRNKAADHNIELSWLRIVIRESGKYGIDPNLTLAVIHVESRGNPDAISTANARGLMQVLPSTGRWIAAMRREEWKGVESLHDPTLNIVYGTWYLNEMLKWADENREKALAAYNGGPGNVQKLGVSPFKDYARMVEEKFLESSI